MQLTPFIHFTLVHIYPPRPGSHCSILYTYIFVFVWLGLFCYFAFVCFKIFVYLFGYAES